MINKSEDKNKNKGKSAADILKDINGESNFIPLNNEPKRNVDDLVTTGSTIIDKLLEGGIEEGDLVLILGDPGCGKTTLALNIMSNILQKYEDKKGLFFDAEHSLKEGYIKTLPSHVINRTDKINTIIAEDVIDSILHVIADKNNDYRVIIIDSINTLILRDSSEQNTIEGTGSGLATLARLLSRSLPRIASEARKKKITLIFINQYRTRINIGFAPLHGNDQIAPGGKALGYYASIKLELSRRQSIKEQEQTIGSEILVKCTKNKSGGISDRKVIVPLFAKGGFSKDYEHFNMALENDIIKRSGAWYYYKEGTLSNSINRSIEILKENKEYQNDIKELIKTL